MKKSHRKLTVSRKYSFRKYQNMPTINPSIKLQGEWLKQAGFAIGQKVSIEIFESMLIITVN